MHHALLVSEILVVIFAHVNQILELSSISEISLARKSLAALATTCKAFHEPAMDVLWAELHQLEPLLGCVTRLHPLIYRRGVRWDYWAKGVEPLSAHEGRQFLRHSARVRSLIIPSDRLFHLLSVIPIEACVFPELQSLTWTRSRRRSSCKYLNLFLPHTLLRCSLSAVSEDLKLIVTRCTALQDLSLNTLDASTADQLSLPSDSVCLCWRLVTLSSLPLDWVAWKHLSNLPTLLRVGN
ncbi:hypothetical protein EDB19DRAFT_142309 [Suillus lakei]|nr:hypothetical protein EDB19DRAFT_142309 [Suillus lakei]